MNWAGSFVAVLGLAVILPASAFAQNPGLNRCKKTIEVTSETSTSVSSVPTIVCSVQFIPTAANAWGVVFDSPSATSQQSAPHGQLRVVAEPGSPNAFDSKAAFFWGSRIPDALRVGCICGSG